MTKSERFFYEHAGFSYDPKTETAEEGHVRCAREMARAEAWALDAGIRYEWRHCDTTSREFRDDVAPYPLWRCVAGNEERGACASRRGIDLGPDGTESDPYARVVEAELALEVMPADGEGDFWSEYTTA